MSKKIVINGCYGGFGLSYKATIAYGAMKNRTILPITYTTEEEIKVLTPKEAVETFSVLYIWEDTGEYFSDYDIPRDDSDLIAVVEALGAEANDRCAELYIVEIPDDVEWEIEEYDGLEHVSEKHRVWR